MAMSPRRLLREAVIPLIFTILVILFLVLQFFATPQALSGLRSLAPAGTSSPRATLEGFRADTERAAALLMEAYQQHKAEPGFFWSQSVTEKVAEAETLLARASRALDLRDIPPVDLQHRQLEATLLLKEVLDRLPLPERSAIPGGTEVAEKALSSWTLPGTEIRIMRVPDGPRAGEYLFSSETVRQLNDFYQLLRTRPNVNGSTADFYDFFSQSPGHLLPPRWYGLIEALPASMRVEIHGQAVWQWVGFFLVIGLVVLGVMGVRGLVSRAEGGGGSVSPLAAKVVLPGSVAVAALLVRYMADNQINLTGKVNDVVEEIAQGIAYIAMIWGILSFSNALAGRLTLSMTQSIDAHLARAAIRIAGIATALTLLVYGASYLGIPLAGVIAGLGVGGLAVALAAKPTLENFIGGLILFADRPVHVGDFCRFGSLEGRVEEIGLRSTRIRGLDRTLITIPNATFVNMNIINLTKRDSMPYERTISLRSSDSAGIRREIDALAAGVAEHPSIERSSVKVRLREGQEERPKVEISALILTSAWDDFLAIQQEIDLMLRDRVLAAAQPEESALTETGNVVPLKDPAEAEKAQA